MLTRALPCANPESGDAGAVSPAESVAGAKILTGEPLTRYTAALNALAPQCQRCGKLIPDHRVAAARRSKVEARWCSASYRVKGCIAKKAEPS